MSELMEIIERLYNEDTIKHEDYSRLFDLVECLEGDIKTQNKMISEYVKAIADVKELLK